MAKLSTLSLGAQSGRSYAFEVYPSGTTFKPLGAVYAVGKRFPAGDGTYTQNVLYIGETADLSERFDDHHKAECFKSREANCINILLEGNHDTRLQIEADLIAKQNPPCNG
jgi:hypothetical protein